MPLEDVSTDETMISWLRQAGHAHVLDDHHQNGNIKLSSPPGNAPYGQTTTSSSSYPPQLTSLHSPPPNIPYGQTTASSNYPPYSISTSSPPPLFDGGHNHSGSVMDALHRASSFSRNDFHPTTAYGGAGLHSPPIMSQSHDYNASPYHQQGSPHHFSSSPTRFLAPNMDQQQLDVNIEQMRRDPNTRVVQRPPPEDVVYKQRVFVRYLQPPTPPVGGTIIVREKQPPGQAPDPPIVIKRAPPPPPTPPPVIIRERPPPMPPTEGTTVIDKIVPAGPKPPRQVVIEQYPALPPKPQDVIIERWLPPAPRQRRILYERLPPNQQIPGRSVIVQYGSPQVRIQREVITTPGIQIPQPQVTGGHTDINQILSQISGNQQIHSSVPSSSLQSYNPYTTIQPNYGNFGQPQSNVIIMQNGQPSTISSSSYGVPLTCVCTPNQSGGLGAYGSGISAVPTIGQSFGQSTVYNVPDNVPVDSILRQLGIDPNTIQRSGSYPSTDPYSAVSHVWNAASHANPPQSIDPRSAVSHVWNAAAHALEHNRPSSPSVGNVWDKIEHYLHPQPSDAVRSAWNHIPHPQPSDAVRSVWNHIPHPQDAVRSVWNHLPHPSSPPPYTSYPQPAPLPMNYPPPTNYSPPPTNYPPPNYHPPPPTNYPPPNYPPSSYPPSSYPPPPPANYPPPNYPPSNYSPPPPTNYPPPSSSYPPSGGPSSGSAGVLSRLFGGGR